MSTQPRQLPSLATLLERRGVRKDPRFGDYQDYIEAQTDKIRPKPTHRQVLSERSIHAAVGRRAITKGTKI